MEQTTPPYSKYIPGLKLALDEIDYKIERAKTFPGFAEGNPKALAYMAALDELRNTIQMYCNQCSREERPGLWTTLSNGNMV